MDSLDEICPKYGTPVILTVLLAYIEATVAIEGHYICLGYKEGVICRVYQSRAGAFRRYSNMLLFLFETQARVSSFLY